MIELGRAAKEDGAAGREDLTGIVNLRRYPIGERDSDAYQALVTASRERLRKDGAAIFPGFVFDDAVKAMAAEAVTLQPKMFRFREEHTVYFKPQEPDQVQSHPLRRMVVTEKDTAAYADIPQGSLVRQLYQADALLDFINDVLQEGPLYRHGDPLAALNIQNFSAGQQLGWHFDRSDFSITLSIQAPEAGGDFEYVRMLRKDGDECYDAVGRFLDDGTTQHVQVLPQVPGTLTMFRGRYSLHRVAPVIGDRLRINAVLAYVDQPGMVFSDYARKLFYGRATA
ncbi:MAG TPA: hypothetical protein VN229_15735 [Terriglobales bacterium]|nr:hypothetical protein [Terriglobales bacterium]